MSAAVEENAEEDFVEVVIDAGTPVAEALETRLKVSARVRIILGPGHFRLTGRDLKIENEVEIQGAGPEDTEVEVDGIAVWNTFRARGVHFVRNNSSSYCISAESSAVVCLEQVKITAESPCHSFVGRQSSKFVSLRECCIPRPSMWLQSKREPVTSHYEFEDCAIGEISQDSSAEIKAIIEAMEMYDRCDEWTFSGALVKAAK